MYEVQIEDQKLASFISAFKEYLWPAASAAPAEDTPSTDKWAVVLSEAGKAAKIGDLIHLVKSNFEFPISSASLSTRMEALEVGMNQGVVVEANEGWKLITHLGPNLVVQMRGKTKEGTISHIGLVHLSSERGVPVFINQLEKLLHFCEGKIELFIGGGTSSSQKLWEKVRGYIDSVNVAHKNRLTLADDCYGITDLAEVYFEQKNRAYIGRASIETAGFDDHNNPFMVLTASFPKGTPVIQDGDVYSMANQDYRIRV